MLAREIEQLGAMATQGVCLTKNGPEPHAAVKERVPQCVEVIDAPGMRDRLVTEGPRLVDPTQERLAERDIDEALRPQILAEARDQRPVPLRNVELHGLAREPARPFRVTPHEQPGGVESLSDDQGRVIAGRSRRLQVLSREHESLAVPARHVLGGPARVQDGEQLRAVSKAPAQGERAAGDGVDLRRRIPLDRLERAELHRLKLQLAPVARLVRG